MYSFLISSLSMYMFTINQNMKVPFTLTKGSSLDLYAIVPGMSVVFSSTYNLNVTVSTKYSNLVYQTPSFSNETDSVRKNLKSVNFGSFTGKIRVVALEDTNFVYETIRGDFDKNESCVIKEDNFTADQENKAAIPPNHQHDHIEHQFPPDDSNRNLPFPPQHQHPGDGNHNRPAPPQHQHPGDHINPQRPGRSNERGSQGYERNHEAKSDGFYFDSLFDSIFSIIVSIGFIALGIALVVSIIRACKNNNCCSSKNNEVDDSSIPPIIQQADNFEQYIPPHSHHDQRNQVSQQQQRVQHIPINYPQLQPVLIPAPAMQAQSQQIPIQPNYHYQQPILIQQPMQNVGTFQGQRNPQ